ncbi:plasminogen activator inhibitor 1 [Culex quinquefasciatus]|uniref:Plasminogen activator inhibitor 1 n=1 Tax=Culex quinquefasciatus TaxID=7176 RepID=B0XAK8_CULQU|nr:plasminogen activator inhibitor 1 [Culex quinquefasciatus]|eukprot:XP_001866680.1 plasminogen activator inhibitor 1 [Culex quinquefasciatus]
MTQKKNRFFWCAVLLISLAFSGESLAARRRPVGSRNAEIEPMPEPTQDDEFDWKLIKTIFSRSPGNAAVSTFSAKYLLNMLYEGTSARTQTQQELSGHLGRDAGVNPASPSIVNTMGAIQTNPDQLISASRIFADEQVSVTQKFTSTVSMIYNSSVENVNFQQGPQAAQTINRWVSEGTRGLIPELVTPQSITGSILLLANTIYFKGLWTHIFPEAATATQPFNTGDGRTVQVPFMKQIVDHYYSEPPQLNAKVLRLPYVNGRFSMILILPNEGSNLNQLLTALSADSIHQAIKSMEETEVKLELPRFKIDHSTSLKEDLQQLGINRIFQDNAELGGISRGGQLPVKVSDVFQKTVIVVDETGSTASSASGSSLVFTIATEPERFVADRPFLFFIEEESTGTVLFAGKVEDPSQ